MTEGDRSLLACSLLVVVLVLFYPAFFLGQVLAPQAALWSYPPWSELGGPNPSLHQPTNRLAFSLAPRLALIQREGAAVALWNPYIGGGRIGWLGMAADGYGPFSVLAALFARDVQHFQALALCVVIFSFAGMFHLARRYLAPCPAVVSALVYTLSGPVVSAWLDVPGTVAVVVPWLLVSGSGGRVLCSPSVGQRRVRFAVACASSSGRFAAKLQPRCHHDRSFLGGSGRVSTGFSEPLSCLFRRRIPGLLVVRGASSRRCFPLRSSRRERFGFRCR
uniref:Uncharacterized protein n=1 Tax=Thermoanaerobaculum aquaticum TaxID=1312852 RepID=A0A7C2NAN1_9BACT